MDDAVLAAIAALALLQVKHVFCDFFFQTPRQIEMKGVYGHPAGLAHAGMHALASLPIFLVLPVRPLIGAAVLLAELLAHYHIDWLKAVISDRKGWTTRDNQYWRGLGLDQFAHQMTYLAIVLALLWLRT